MEAIQRKKTCKNVAERLRVTTFAIEKLEEQLLFKRSNREKLTF